MINKQEGGFMAIGESMVSEVVCEVLECEQEELDGSSSFRLDLGASSMMLLSLFVELEKVSGKKIPSDDFEKLDSIDEVIHYLS